MTHQPVWKELDDSIKEAVAEMVAAQPELQPAVSEVVWIGGPPGQAWGIPFIPRFKEERIDTIFKLYAVLQKGTLRKINKNNLCSPFYFSAFVSVSAGFASYVVVLYYIYLFISAALF